jgi:hypothetical protein
VKKEKKRDSRGRQLRPLPLALFPFLLDLLHLNTLGQMLDLLILFNLLRLNSLGQILVMDYRMKCFKTLQEDMV